VLEDGTAIGEVRIVRKFEEYTRIRTRLQVLRRWRLPSSSTKVGNHSTRVDRPIGLGMLLTFSQDDWNQGDRQPFSAMRKIRTRRELGEPADS